MLRNKKGELSINVIIVAILALLVLVILGTIFAGKLGNFRKNSDTCTTNGGSCTDKTVGCQQDQYQKEITGNCYQSDGKTIDSNKVCCIRT